MTVAKRFRASFLHPVPTHGVETLLLVFPAKSTGALVAFGPACSQVRGSTLGEEKPRRPGDFHHLPRDLLANTHPHKMCVTPREMSLECPHTQLQIKWFRHYFWPEREPRHEDKELWSSPWRNWLYLGKNEGEIKDKIALETNGGFCGKKLRGS